MSSLRVFVFEFLEIKRERVVYGRVNGVATATRHRSVSMCVGLLGGGDMYR